MAVATNAGAAGGPRRFADESQRLLATIDSYRRYSLTPFALTTAFVYNYFLCKPRQVRQRPTSFLNLIANVSNDVGGLYGRIGKHRVALKEFTVPIRGQQRQFAIVGSRSDPMGEGSSPKRWDIRALFETASEQRVHDLNLPQVEHSNMTLPVLGD